MLPDIKVTGSGVHLDFFCGLDQPLIRVEINRSFISISIVGFKGETQVDEALIKMAKLKVGLTEQHIVHECQHRRGDSSGRMVDAIRISTTQSFAQGKSGLTDDEAHNVAHVVLRAVSSAAEAEDKARKAKK